MARADHSHVPARWFACRWGRAASAATPTLPHRSPPAARQHRQPGVDGFQTRRGWFAHERSDSTIGRQGRRRTEPQRPLRLALAAATARCRRADPPRWTLRARRVWPAMARDSPKPRTPSSTSLSVMRQDGRHRPQQPIVGPGGRACPPRHFAAKPHGCCGNCYAISVVRRSHVQAGGEPSQRLVTCADRQPAAADRPARSGAG